MNISLQMSDEQFEHFFAVVYGYAYSPFNSQDIDGKRLAHSIIQQLTPIAKRHHGYGYDKYMGELQECLKEVKGMDIHLQKKSPNNPKAN